MSTTTTFNAACSGLMAVLMAVMLLGCEDDTGYELVSGGTLECAGDAQIGRECTTNDLPGTWQCLTRGMTCVSGGSGLNPGGEDNNPPGVNSCKSVPPSFWDVRSYKGCMSTSELNGAYRMDNKEYCFKGKPFTENSNGAIGELYYLTSEGSDCGPMTMAIVSNSGTVSITAGRDVDWYLVEPALAEVVWQKLHNNAAPSASEIQSGAFASLLLDIFECEVTNTSCSLKSTIPGGWPTYGGGLVTYQHTGPNATTDGGAFCGYMYIVAHSR